jgi:hypothetical protein
MQNGMQDVLFIYVYILFVSGEGKRHDGQGWQCCSIYQGIMPTGEKH